MSNRKRFKTRDANTLAFYGIQHDKNYETAADPETMLTDLLADLRHYAGARNIDLLRCFEMAETHFEAEQAC